MIIFHEGLPRSGKSYEAMVRRIIPALQAGREVVAYIEGLDVEKIAVAAGMSPDVVHSLLHPVTRAQMVVEETNQQGKIISRQPAWLALCRDNALHIFDEAQNFWGNRAKMSNEETQLVTEHGHRGMDIVLMGQDYRDVHALWRRRLEIKLAFLKLSGLGAENRYSVTTWRHKGGDEYEKVGTETHKYDPKYFGTYASHVGTDTNTANYKDDRSNVFKQPMFKYGMPAVLALGVWGAVTAYKFFQPETHVKPKTESVSAEKFNRGGSPGVQITPAVAQNAPAAPIQAAPPPPPLEPAEKLLVDLSSKYRVRYSGTIESASRLDGFVEWYDGGTRVMERLPVSALVDLGVKIEIGNGYAMIKRGAFSVIATQWPVEDQVGKVSKAQQSYIKGEPLGQRAPVFDSGRPASADPVHDGAVLASMRGS